MRDGAGHYLRFVRDLRGSSGNNEAEQVIRMSKPLTVLGTMLNHVFE